MTAELVALLIDKGISLAVAFVGLLLAYRKIGPKPGENPRFDEWSKKYERVAKILSWALLACVVPVLVADVVRVTRH